MNLKDLWPDLGSVGGVRVHFGNLAKLTGAGGSDCAPYPHTIKLGIHVRNMFPGCQSSLCKRMYFTFPVCKRSNITLEACTCSINGILRVLVLSLGMLKDVTLQEAVSLCWLRACQSCDDSCTRAINIVILIKLVACMTVFTFQT